MYMYVPFLCFYLAPQQRSRHDEASPLPQMPQTTTVEVEKWRRMVRVQWRCRGGEEWWGYSEGVEVEKNGEGTVKV